MGREGKHLGVLPSRRDEYRNALPQVRVATLLHQRQGILPIHNENPLRSGSTVYKGREVPAAVLAREQRNKWTLNEKLRHLRARKRNFEALVEDGVAAVTNVGCEMGAILGDEQLCELRQFLDVGEDGGKPIRARGSVGVRREGSGVVEETGAPNDEIRAAFLVDERGQAPRTWGRTESGGVRLGIGARAKTREGEANLPLQVVQTEEPVYARGEGAGAHVDHAVRIHVLGKVERIREVPSVGRDIDSEACRIAVRSVESRMHHNDSWI